MQDILQMLLQLFRADTRKSLAVLSLLYSYAEHRMELEPTSTERITLVSLKQSMLQSDEGDDMLIDLLCS
jgi:replication-associated recombination protein RarA